MPTQMPRNGPPVAAHRLVERLDHAGHRVEPAPAVREGADAGQHHAVGAAHRVGIAGDQDRLVVAGLARRALERLGGRVQIARPVIDDGDASPRALPAAGNRPITSEAGRAGAAPGWRAGAAARGRRRHSAPRSRPRRTAVRPPRRSSPTTMPRSCQRRRSRVQRRRVAASKPTSSAIRNADQRPRPPVGTPANRKPTCERRHQHDVADQAPATAGARASRAGRTGTRPRKSRRARTRTGRHARRRLRAAPGGSNDRIDRHERSSQPVSRRACPWSRAPRPRARIDRDRRAQRPRQALEAGLRRYGGR